MGLFSRKTKTHAPAFARAFYDRYVFGLAPGGDPLVSTYADTARDLITKADPSFSEVDGLAFEDELLALWMEMIGTAWTHQSKDDASLAVSEFTNRYLVEADRSDIWAAMLEYNQSIARSAVHGIDPNSRMGRARIAVRNQERLEFGSNWLKRGHDPEATARILNRAWSLPAWKSGVTQSYLARRMTARLGIAGSEPIWGRLAATAHGFYQGARESLERVTLVP